jgi:hypothetical protein
MLPDTRPVGDGWEPGLPLIPAPCDIPGLLIILQLSEHIEWAQAHGVLEAVDAFLRSLQESEWYHLGD